MIIISSLFFLIAAIFQLHAVLDGRITPIYLENRYSFTHYEWARGKVYFKNGFDLPTNGTVIMDITQEVHGKILFRKSTLRLLNDLRLALNGALTGSGFIDAQANSIFFKNDWQPLPSEQFVFISNVTFRGLKTNALDFSRAGTTGGISFAALGTDDIYFMSLALGPFAGNNLNLSTFRPTRLYIVDCTLRLGNQSFTINSWEVRFSGENLVLASENIQLNIPNRLFFGNYSSLYVSNSVTLNIKQIFSFDTSSILILDNARLIYDPLTTPQPFFKASFGGGIDKGRFVVRGKSSLRIPTGKVVAITAPTDLSFEAGAHLELESNSQLRIE